MKIRFKATFLKDIKKLPIDYKQKIEYLIFNEISKIDSYHKIKNIRKIHRNKNYYRIRVGNYRIGFRVIKDDIIFMRVLHRKDIFRYFP